jgi:uncharacterized membrane protein YeaQ/YmgE (transglycosylase-associated protein family)
MDFSIGIIIGVIIGAIGTFLGNFALEKLKNQREIAINKRLAKTIFDGIIDEIK